MRQLTLRILTWGTVTAAISSALWLASGDPGWPEMLKGDPPGPMVRLPSDASRADDAAAGSGSRHGTPPQRGERSSR